MKKGLGLTTEQLAIIALLSAISFVLAFFEIPMPLSPSFAMMDLSDLPAVLAAFSIGPWGGVLVEVIKNLLQATSSSTGGIGELANCLMGCAYVLPAGLIYQRNKTKKGALYGCIAGSLSIGVVAAVLNYFVLLPMFEMFMPIDQIIAMFSDILPFIHTKFDVCLYNALPGNIFKGVIISIISMLIYKPLSPVLHYSRSASRTAARRA
ncbi:MAG: ECF transporter S component [Mogibacterium sp.]|nr:ECF transporter S component [Mogibacterium sp.]